MLVLTVNINQHFTDFFEHGHRYWDRHLYDIYSVHWCLCSVWLTAHPQSPGYQIPFLFAWEGSCPWHKIYQLRCLHLYHSAHIIRSHASTEDEVKRTNYQRFPYTRCPLNTFSRSPSFIVTLSINTKLVMYNSCSMVKLPFSARKRKQAHSPQRRKVAKI